jgi:uncharacterized membrane protein (DUF4010 family)
MDLVLIYRLGLALAIGLLVGLERGWREREAAPGSRTAGIRTYGISGLLGGVVAAYAAAADSDWIMAVAFLAFSLLFGWFKSHESEHDDNFSFTGVAAALAVFALGGLAVAGDPLAAAAGGTSLAVLLASREMLHGLLRRLSWLEVRGALVLAVMTAVVLPLLPNTTYDPWNALNPREIWIFTLLAAAFSYLGYIMTRIVGPSRGLIYSCIAGALVSSTAMTLALARTPGNGRRLAGAAALAATVSILRVLLYATVMAPPAMAIAGPAALVAALVFALCGWFMLSGMTDADLPPDTSRNPLRVQPLVLFAAIFAAMSLLSAISTGYFGTAGLSTTAAIAGMADVDVAVLSMLRLQGGSVATKVLGQAVLAAFASNAVVRFASAAAIAPRAFSLPLGAVTLAALVAGAATYLILPAISLAAAANG